MKSTNRRPGEGLPYPYLINAVLALLGGSQTLRLRFWSRHRRHSAEKVKDAIQDLTRKADTKLAEKVEQSKWNKKGQLK